MELKLVPTLYQRVILESLFCGAVLCDLASVVGDVAEFGVWNGESAAVLALGIATSEAQYGFVRAKCGLKPRTLHLFESFRGLPKITERSDLDSPHVKAGVWVEGASTPQQTSAQIHDAVATHIPRDRIKMHDGWFKDTVPAMAPGTRFALLHLDVGLYEAGMDVLGGSFRKGLISEGAQVFLAAWNTNLCSPRHGARRAWGECVETYGIEFSDSGEYGAIGKKFIVHGYKGMPQ